MGGSELREMTHFRELPRAAPSCPERTAGPQYLTTLPSKTLTFAVLPPPKRLHDNSFSRVFADSSTQNHTFAEIPRSCKGKKKGSPTYFSDSSTQNASFIRQNLRMGRHMWADKLFFPPWDPSGPPPAQLPPAGPPMLRNASTEFRKERR